MAVYLNKYQGIVSLYVNGILITKKQFRSRIRRQEIMKEWNYAFRLVASLGIVYYQVSHYEVKYDPDIKENIETKLAPVKVKKKTYDKRKVPEQPEINITRPKAEYSNRQFNDYSDKQG